MYPSASGDTSRSMDLESAETQSTDQEELTSESDCRLQEFDDFERMLDDPKYSDVTFIFDNCQKFYVHKAILASRSPYFAQLFEGILQEHAPTAIEVYKVEYEVMKEVLRFIYAGKVNNIKRFAWNLFILADLYKLDNLKVMCEKAIIDKINIENVSNANTVNKLLIFIDTYKTDKLRNHVINIVKANARQLLEIREFNDTMEKLSKPLLDSLVEVLKVN